MFVTCMGFGKFETFEIVLFEELVENHLLCHIEHVNVILTLTVKC